MICLSLLVNNTLCTPLLSEHGLSVWVEMERGDGRKFRLLLDTGQHGKTLLANAAAKDIDLMSADYVVVSHGHYDHSGGLEALAAMGYDGRVVVGRGAECLRYSLSLGAMPNGQPMKKENGMVMPTLIKTMGAAEIDGVEEIAPGITLFTLPQAAPPNPRLIDANGNPDTFADELFALIDDGTHCVLYGGCTHHGVEQLLRFSESVLHRRHIDLFVGGLHLMGRNVGEIDRASLEAKKYDVGAWMLLHCTGPEAAERWKQIHQVIEKETFTL